MRDTAVELQAGDFADFPDLNVVCHDQPMTVASAVIDAGDGEYGRLIHHRIIRVCPACRSAVVTTLITPAPEDAT
jgi:hypothetical protein